MSQDKAQLISICYQVTRCYHLSQKLSSILWSLVIALSVLLP
ncbi:hypothetical protein OAD64_02035 [Oceanospirillaceae bacterium]|nr:hypothetical protein [Oceanospirillaceae bacterium]